MLHELRKFLLLRLNTTLYNLKQEDDLNLKFVCFSQCTPFFYKNIPILFEPGIILISASMYKNYTILLANKKICKKKKMYKKLYKVYWEKKIVFISCNHVCMSVSLVCRFHLNNVFYVYIVPLVFILYLSETHSFRNFYSLEVYYLYYPRA